MQLFGILMAGFASAGLAIAVLAWAFRSPRLQPFILSEDPHRSVSDRKLYRAVVLNSAVSTALIFGMTFGFRDVLFRDGTALPLWGMVCEGVAVILIYDFAYYFVHRFLFHEWTILRNVHAVHHAARYPRAVDSFLLHPIETFVGLALLLGSIAVIGGIHLYTFGPIFVLYTTVNILNHAGISIPRFPFRTLGVLAEKHDRHHHSMLAGNYASITPLPDFIFGTLE